MQEDFEQLDETQGGKSGTNGAQTDAQKSAQLSVYFIQCEMTLSTRTGRTQTIRPPCCTCTVPLCSWRWPVVTISGDGRRKFRRKSVSLRFAPRPICAPMVHKLRGNQTSPMVTRMHCNRS